MRSTAIECGAGGNVCVNPDVLPTCDGSACCTPFCNLDLGGDPCAAIPGTVCVQFFEIPPPQYEHVGVCILPP
jgi:hypothetical protein